MTPMQRQYAELKSQVPDAVLFFRLGDFYEMFDEDAIRVAPVLEITLTSRGGVTPMCGVPAHSADSYIRKLVSLGYKVAICEQTTEPTNGKGIVKREIIRVVTPGTADGADNGDRTNYLAAVWRGRDWGLAGADLSTGDFFIFQTDALQELKDELSLIQPAELLVPPGLTALPGWYASPLDYSPDPPALRARFPRQEDMLRTYRDAAAAASGLWQYVEHNLPLCPQAHIPDIRYVSRRECMLLDRWTRRNLELTESLRGSEKGTLFSVLNLTRTTAGSRLLRHWLERPLIRREAILTRQERVAFLAAETFLRQDLRKLLTRLHDPERLLGKLSYGRGGARELFALAGTLAALPEIYALLGTEAAAALWPRPEGAEALAELARDLLAAVDPDAPPGVRDGGLVLSGYDAEVDKLRAVSTGGKQWIAEMESRERAKTGIRSLKIGYTRVFGYYIEITRANVALAPPEYERRQTLAGAERYTTPELKEQERILLTAEEEICRLEFEIFQTLKEKVFALAAEIRQAARCLAELDIFAALAEGAAAGNYVRPEITEGGSLLITEGRHPVIEKLAPDINFVPNDTLLSPQKHLALITGPNMAGKSTYMRQVALIVLMAQTGAFVPAAAASIPLTDCIYTRIGASDNLAEGQSTFMVEMREVAHILSRATADSLVVLDEVGRGTATFDGLSLAWALAEHLTAGPVLPKTLFATHYHELTRLEGSRPGLFNLHVAVAEEAGDIVFLHKILPGSMGRSYGLQVAKLAGLPPELLERAARILAELENSEQHRRKLRSAQAKPVQPSLFAAPPPPEPPVLKELRALNPEDLSPRQALDYLYELRGRLGDEAANA
ncbi:MAG: DNA mismatch repair protein MutS [Gracilibacteraceae bacterium]|jgi:DNA mismatch repair protein MutS|nr:DNA mismatch repair protein MutS [Gracilibacteraceae bacterium]